MDYNTAYKRYELKWFDLFGSAATGDYQLNSVVRGKGKVLHLQKLSKIEFVKKAALCTQLQETTCEPCDVEGRRNEIIDIEATLLLYSGHAAGKG